MDNDDATTTTRTDTAARVTEADSRFANELREAVQRGDLIAAFQPQFDLETNRIVSVEVLCRWLHPELGLLMPYAFIPLAESSDLIHAIGRFMTHEACTAVAAWRAAGQRVTVSINVSPVQLGSDEFVENLFAEMAAAGVIPSDIVLEITETTPILDLEPAQARLRTLQNAGVAISVDDYGIGHSSLFRLELLRADELKIDQSLVKSESTEVRAHMAGVIEFAHARGIRVVAEGVETAKQLDAVTALGCDRAQGFLLARPMSQRELAQRFDQMVV
jgi:EAL domain-containing protein (putative c-di-GMP-specific phosphodiesterase class I)